ncbi:MAG: methyltransferase [Treponema sp.]|nr:methyltransferase [Treponema sp.]
MRFKFRGKGFSFALSQGLFSAAAIDTGTGFLLKVLSQQWDKAKRHGLPLPKTVLDAGCGVGVIGICVAGALGAPEDSTLGQCHVRCQDRDELATVITEYNAQKNRIPPGLLSSHTEPLLGGPLHARWDLIVSNIPAKAGKPVLVDFICRSAALLNPEGSVLIVVVNPLADFFRAHIAQANLPLQYDKPGREHRVFMYGPLDSTPHTYGSVAYPGKGPLEPVQGGGYLLQDYPMYHRRRGDYVMEGIGYSLDTIQGVADFDTPSGAVQVAAKLISRLNRDTLRVSFLGSILIYEPGQGHFPRWFLEYLTQAKKPQDASGVYRWVFFSRNILALEASRYNMYPETVRTVLGLDLSVNRKTLAIALEPESRTYDLILGFPQFVPQTDRIIPLWEGLRELLSPGGMGIIALPASEAERFDRKKPSGFNRLGDCKRNGFRALGYQVSS